MAVDLSSTTAHDHLDAPLAGCGFVEFKAPLGHHYWLEGPATSLLVVYRPPYDGVVESGVATAGGGRTSAR